MKNKIAFFLFLVLASVPATAETTWEAVSGAFSDSWNRKVISEHMKTLNPEIEAATAALNQGLPTPLCGYQDIGFTSAASLRLAISELNKKYGKEFSAVPLTSSSTSGSEVCILVSPKAGK